MKIILLFTVLIWQNIGIGAQYIGGASAFSYGLWLSGSNVFHIYIEHYFTLRADDGSFNYCNKSVYQSLPSANLIKCNPECHYTYHSVDLTCSYFNSNENWAEISNTYYHINFVGVNVQYNDVFVLSSKTYYWNADQYNWLTFFNRTTSITGEWNQKPSLDFDFIRTHRYKYKVPGGRQSFLKLPINNYDNDTIRCRASKFDGPYGVECKRCDMHPITLDEVTCTLYFPSTLKSNVLIELQMEDFKSINDTIPMSSVSVQMTIEPDWSDSGDDVPKFTSIVPENGSCIGISPNNDYHGIIESYTNTSNPILSIDVFAFEGFSTSLMQFDSIRKVYYVNYTIDVKAVNKEILVETVIIRVSDGISTTSRFLSYVINYESVKVKSIYPLDEICYKESGTYDFNITFNQIVLKPHKNSYIRIVEYNTSRPYYEVNAFYLNQINSTSIKISLGHFQLTKGFSYSFVFERGAVIGNGYCNPILDVVDNLDKFKFKIIHDPPYNFRFLYTQPTYVNHSAIIEYSIVSGIVDYCYLYFNEQLLFRIDCTQTVAIIKNMSMLDSGNYKLIIGYRTSCLPNTTESYEWVFVKEPPNVSLLTVGIRDNFASKNVEITYKCIYRFQCQMNCQFTKKSNTEILYSDDCSSATHYKPSASMLNHGEHYEFAIYALDLFKTYHQVAAVQFQIDNEPPKLNSTEMNRILDCGLPIDNLTMPIVYDDLDPSPTISYLDRNVNPCSVTRELSAIDHVGNRLRFDEIISFISNAKINYNSLLYVSCITNQQVLEDLRLKSGYITIENNLCNAKISINPLFPQMPINDCDFDFNMTWSISDNCNNIYPTVTQTIKVGIRKIPYSPIDGQINAELLVAFKWPFHKNAKLYSLLLRKNTDTVYTSIANVSNNHFFYGKKLLPGTSYKWKVKYFDEKGEILQESDEWEFTTKMFSDLSLIGTRGPTHVYPDNTDILITWTVENIGNITTSTSTWYDAVFGSEYSEFDRATLLATVVQHRFLQKNEQYSSAYQFKLPERYKSLEYYIFIIVDYYHNIDDDNFKNNQQTKPEKLDVSKLPLPNLRPEVIKTNIDIGKANEKITITYEVGNRGEANTKLKRYWTDNVALVEIGESKNFYETDLRNDFTLKIGLTYSRSIEILLPLKYYGNVSIILDVNKYDTLYESSLLDNQIVKIIEILPPDTPDLNIIEHTSNMTIIAGQSFIISYRVINDGLSETNSYYWYDTTTMVSVNTNKEILKSINQIYGNYSILYS